MACQTSGVRSAASSVAELDSRCTSAGASNADATTTLAENSLVFPTPSVAVATIRWFTLKPLTASVTVREV